MSPPSINNNIVSLNKSVIQCNDECRQLRNSEYHGTGSDPQYDVYPISLPDRKYSFGIPHETGQSGNKSCKSLSYVMEHHSATNLLDTNCEQHPMPTQKEKTSIDKTDVPIADKPKLSNDGNSENSHHPENSYFKNEHWGDSIMPKSENTLRLYFQNINDLKPNNCWDKWQKLIAMMSQLSIDITGIVETNLR